MCICKCMESSLDGYMIKIFINYKIKNKMTVTDYVSGIVTQLAYVFFHYTCILFFLYNFSMLYSPL